MTWMAKLYQTYEQALKLNLADEDKLMPISHTLQNAHINIVIDAQGNFKRAKVLENPQIILPATESSAGRSSGEAPHPLADKLQYVAKDYAQYGGLKKAYFESYRSQLTNWCDSQFTHPKAKAIYQYIEKGQVIADLIKSQIVHVDDSNVLRTNWPFEATAEKPIPHLFKVLPKEKGHFEQGSALVCWTVESDGDPSADTWNDPTLQESWIAFDASRGTEEDVCYVTGAKVPLAVNHPAKLRHSGDKAKLISSNDTSGFTYRGKFIDGAEAVGISFEVTQKAHNALRWLIARQGHRIVDQAIVAWSVSGKPIPDPMADSYSLIDWDDLEEVEIVDIKENNSVKDYSNDLGQSYAVKLNKKMAGYLVESGNSDNVIIMAMNSATPGRMSIVYYREYFINQFINQVEAWHQEFAWQQRHVINLPAVNGKKPKTKVIWRISSPLLGVIAETAYGKTLTDSLKKNIYERLLPCIVEKRPLPIDILNMCVQRACNPMAGEYWEWEKSLGVACALYRGFYHRLSIQTKRRNYQMSLETDNTSRDYLYGRLLAVAENIEQFALSISDEKRPTTAERLMQRFADRPASTWRNIELALNPYMQKLQTNRRGFWVNRKRELDVIINSFKTDDFTSDKKLSGEFLLGFHCQRQHLQNKQPTENQDNQE